MAATSRTPKDRRTDPDSTSPVAPSTLVCDPDQLTIAEAEVVEELTGRPIYEVFGGQPLTLRERAAIVLVVLRRTRPEATLDDARAVPVVALQVVSGGPPDPPAADG